MLYGVIKFYHPEIEHTETVLCETEAEMHNNLSNSLESGFPPEQIVCWVKNEHAANKLFAVMDVHSPIRSRCFALTE